MVRNFRIGSSSLQMNIWSGLKVPLTMYYMLSEIISSLRDVMQGVQYIVSTFPTEHKKTNPIVEISLANFLGNKYFSFQLWSFQKR